jgi:hypothetical protein
MIRESARMKLWFCRFQWENLYWTQTNTEKSKKSVFVCVLFPMERESRKHQHRFAKIRG